MTDDPRILSNQQIDAARVAASLRSPEWLAKALAHIAAQAEQIEALKKLDGEAATYVESVIALRTHFTGDHPYVGWKGLGLALNEHLDRAEVAEAKLALVTKAAEGMAVEAIRVRDRLAALGQACFSLNDTISTFRAAVSGETKQPKADVEMVDPTITEMNRITEGAFTRASERPEDVGKTRKSGAPRDRRSDQEIVVANDRRSYTIEGTWTDRRASAQGSGTR